MTQQVLNLLKIRRNSLKDMWADGAFAGPSFQEMTIRNAAAQGAASTLQDILDIDYLSLQGNNDD